MSAAMVVGAHSGEPGFRRTCQSSSQWGGCGGVRQAAPYWGLSWQYRLGHALNMLQGHGIRPVSGFECKTATRSQIIGVNRVTPRSSMQSTFMKHACRAKRGIACVLLSPPPIRPHPLGCIVLDRTILHKRNQCRRKRPRWSMIWLLSPTD